MPTYNINGKLITVSDLPTSFGSTVDVPQDYLDYTKPEDRSLNDLANMSAVLADKQGLGDEVLRGIQNFAVSTIAGGVLAFAANDPTELVGAVTGQKREFGNSLSEWARRFMEDNTKEIYEKNPGSVNPFDSAWYFKYGSQLGLSLGIGIEGLVEGVGVSYATGGMGTAAEAVNLARKAKNLTSAFNAIKKSERMRAAFTGTYAFNGLKEALIESDDAFHGVYDQMLSRGLSEEEARQAAANAASVVFNANAVYKTTTGALVGRLMTYSPVSGLEGGLMDGMIDKIKNPLLKKAAFPLAGAVEEGTEEALQYIFQEEGKYKADMMTGFAPDNGFGERMGSYLQSSELWNSAIVGAAGGAVMMPGFHAVVKKALGRNKSPYIKEHDAMRDMGIGMTMENIEKMAEAQSNGDVERMQQIVNEHSTMESIKRLHLDALAGKGTELYDEHLEFLESILEAAKNNDIDLLKKNNANNPLSIESILKTYPEMIEKAKRIKELYYEEAEIQDGKLNYIPQVVARRFLVEENNKHVIALRAELAKLKMQETQYGDLSAWYLGKKELEEKLKLEQIRLNMLDRKWNALSENDLKTAKKQRAAANRAVTILQKKLEKHAEDDQRTTEEKEQDELLKDANPNPASIIARENAIEELRLENERAVKEIVNWRDEEFQKLQEKNRTRRIIRNSTPEDVKKIKEQLSEKEREEFNKEIETAENATPVTDKPVVSAEQAERKRVNDKTYQAFEELSLFTDKESESTDDSELNSEAERMLSMRSINTDDANKRNFGKAVASYINNNDLRGKSFEEILTHMMDDREGFGVKRVKQAYFAIVAGWNHYANQQHTSLAPVTEAQAKEFYDYEFSDKDPGATFGLTYVDEIPDVYNEPQLTEPDKRVEDTTSNENIVQYRNEFSDGEYQHADGRGNTLSTPSVARAVVNSVERRMVKMVDGKRVILQKYEHENELNETDKYDLLALDDWRDFSVGKQLTIKLPSEEEILDTKFTPRWTEAYTKDRLLLGKKMEFVDRGKTLVFKDVLDGITVKVKTPQGERTIELHIEKGSDAYWAAVPMKVYDGDRAVGYHHTLDYIHESNVNLKKVSEKTVAAIRDEVMRIRNEVRADNVSDITITSTTRGIIPRELAIDPTPIAEQDPENQSIVALYHKGKFINSILKNQNLVSNKQSFLENLKRYQGSVLVLYPNEHGYHAMPVLSEKLLAGSKFQKEIETSILYALHNMLTGKNQLVNGRDLSKTRETIQYIKQFVRTNHEFFQYDPNNQRLEVFNAKGEAFELHSGSGNNALSVRSPFWADKNGNPRTLREYLQQEVFPTIKLEVSYDALNKNETVEFIGINPETKEGQVISSEMNYQMFVKHHLMTTTPLFNVGSQENPLYTPFLQRGIGYERTSIAKEKFPDLEEQKPIVNPVKKAEAIVKKEQQDIQEKIVEEWQTEKELTENDTSSVKTEAVSKNTLPGLTEEGTMLVDQGIAMMAHVISNDERTVLSFDDFFSETQLAPLSQTQKEKLRSSIHAIEGLLPHEQKEFVQQLANAVLAEVPDLDLLDVTDVKYEAKVLAEYYVNTKSAQLLEHYQKLETLAENFPQIEMLLGDYRAAFNKIDAIRNNIDTLIADVVDKVDLLRGVSDETSDVPYDKQAEEISVKNSASYNMRKFFFGVLDLDKQGRINTGFMGVPKYIQHDEVFDRVSSMLADTGSDFQHHLEVLKSNSIVYDWIYNPKHDPEQGDDLITKLQQVDRKTQKEFSYLMAKHALTMKTILFEKKDTGYTFTVADTNSHNNTRAVVNEWKDLMRTRLTEFDETSKAYVFNKEKVKALYDQLHDWIYVPGLRNTLTPEDLHDWFRKTGVQLSLQHVTRWMGNGGFQNDFEKSFEEGFMKDFYKFLKKIVSTKESVSLGEGLKRTATIDSLSFYDLAKTEALFTKARLVTSLRDGGKTIYGFTQNTFASDRTLELKRLDNTVYNRLKEGHFSRNSLLLELLEEDEEFRKTYNTSVVANVTLKDLNSRFANDKGITNLPEVDHEMSKIGMFSYMKEKILNKPIALASGATLERRIGTMLGLTMSDKTRAYAFTTALYNFRSKHFTEKGLINEDIQQLIFDHYVQPEIERIQEHKGDMNISGYAPQNFYLFPTLNNVMVEIQGEQYKLSALINDEKYADEYKELSEKAIKDELQRLFYELKEEKKAEWANMDILKGLEIVADKDYLETIQGDNQIDIFAYDYVLNNILHNAEMYKLYALDPAYYYKGKNEKVIDNMFDTFTNVGKRLARLNAPGNQLADSEQNRYIQLFLEDNEQVDERYPELGKLTSTDAQEYMTWNEFMYVLDNTGRIEDYLGHFTIDELDEALEHYGALAQYERLSNALDRREIKVEKYKELVKQLAKDNDLKLKTPLSDREKVLIRKIFQPIIKPVYTGTYYDASKKMMRPVYIKSSAHVLIPQLTEGTELDKLRQKMEEIEKKEGKTVRASYQSANKVGAIKNAYQMVREDGSFDVSTLSVDEYGLELDRKYFRIQQEVPSKSKLKEHNEISMGTQMTKLMFGDGVIDLNFKLGDETVSGQDLYQKYVGMFKELLTLRKEEFMNEFMLDENGEYNPEQKAEAIQKVNDLLQKEARTRGWTKQDREGISLDTDGNFVFPVAFNTNADKIEALLHSLVTKKITGVKMPGYSYVVASENGFRLTTDFSGVDKSKIVWTDKPLQRKLEWDEVLIPCRYKLDGKDIDLINDGFAKQVVEDGKTFWKLDKEKMSPELLEIISFRIPTSKHASISPDKIVGFLPQSAGDMMVVSAAKTKIKGLDFDVDKEFTYHFATQIKNGKLIRMESGEEDSAKKRELLLLNKIIELQMTVLKDPKVKEKIFKVINTDFVESNVAAFDRFKSGNYKNFTPLSDTYQREKMVAGASGKIALGAASIDVVAQAQLEQLYSDHKGVQLRTLVPEVGWVPYSLTIGNHSSDGILGRVFTLDGTRSIADLLSEYQNMSADNEKLQILGRVNLNSYTLSFYKMLNLLGFDRGEMVDGADSIAFYLLNQPIILQYVEMMEKIDSQLGSTMSKQDKQNHVFRQLFKDVSIVNPESLTNKVLHDQIVNKTDPAVQNAVLSIFKELTTFGETFQKIQTTINKDSKGLDISYFDTILDMEMLEKIGFPDQKKDVSILSLDGIKNMVGKYVVSDEKPKGEGWIHLRNDKWVRPTTISGMFTAEAVSTAYHSWKKFFPYEHDLIFGILKTVHGDDFTSDQAYKLFKEFKKFVYSSSKLFETDDLQKLRYDLAIDKGEKMSLAKYLLTNKETRLFSENVLLRNLRYEIHANPKRNGYSFVKFNNTMEDAYGEEDFHRAFVELLLDDQTELPSFNGASYTPNQLAVDLIRYAFLEGGVQEAFQFVKYVPLDYLDTVGFIDEIRLLNNVLINNTLKRSEVRDLYNRFLKQYAGHAPRLFQKISKDNFKKLTHVNPGTEIFYIDSNPFPEVFSVYDKRKYNVYVKMGEKDGVTAYVKIKRNLGESGMSEYNALVDDPVSNIHDTPDYASSQETLPLEQKGQKVDGKHLLENVAANISVNEGYNKLASHFLGNKEVMGLLSGVTIEIGDYKSSSYEPQTNTIRIKNDLLDPAQNSEDVVRDTLHEMIHALTYQKLKVFERYNDKLVYESAPKHIRELIDLYNLVSKHVPNDAIRKSMYRKVSLIKKGKAKGNDTILTAEEHRIYGISNLYEFVTESLTNPMFQDLLNEVKVENKSLFDRFVDFVNSILESLLGKKVVNEDSALKPTLHNVLRLIESGNPQPAVEKQAEPMPEELTKTENVDQAETLLNEIEVGTQTKKSAGVIRYDELSLDDLNELNSLRSTFTDSNGNTIC